MALISNFSLNADSKAFHVDTLSWDSSYTLQAYSFIIALGFDAPDDPAYINIVADFSSTGSGVFALPRSAEAVPIVISGGWKLHEC